MGNAERRLYRDEGILFPYGNRDRGLVELVRFLGVDILLSRCTLAVFAFPSPTPHHHTFNTTARYSPRYCPSSITILLSAGTFPIVLLRGWDRVILLSPLVIQSGKCRIGRGREGRPVKYARRVRTTWRSMVLRAL